MRSSLRLTRVDWGWYQRTELERAIIRKYQPQLEDRQHVVDSFATVLSRASSELPGVEVAALVEDVYRARTLLIAQGGQARRIAIKDTTRRGSWSARPWLPLDSVATLVRSAAAQEVWDVLTEAASSDHGLVRNGDELELPLTYRSELHLRWAMELVAEAMIGTLAQYVAQVGYQRYLVTLRPRTVEVEALIPLPSSSSETHERVIRGLLAADPDDLFPVVVSARRRLASGSTAKLDQALRLAEPMLHDLQQQAARIDRSLSWVVQKAWQVARDGVGRLPHREAAAALVRGGAAQRIRRHTLFFPGEMLVEMEDQASRLGCSISWVVQAAYALARVEIIALPGAESSELTVG